MEQPVLLWIDLTNSEQALALPASVEQDCTIHSTCSSEQIAPMISAVKPSVLCFDYDYPDSAGLDILFETKREYPKLPILMLTVYHSEALAVWALRARVWDYIVKPFSAEDFLRSVTSLFRVCWQPDRRAPREVVSPIQDFLHIDSPQGHEKSILKAQSYIVQHLQEEIRLKDVAEHCGMSATYFSRVFTQTSETNFNEFVRRTRVRRAIDMLANPRATIKGVCYEVGFNDLSYFGRTFRRYVGMTPSTYQKTILNDTDRASRLYTQMEKDVFGLQ